MRHNEQRIWIGKHDWNDPERDILCLQQEHKLHGKKIWSIYFWSPFQKAFKSLTKDFLQLLNEKWKLNVANTQIIFWLFYDDVTNGSIVSSIFLLKRRLFWPIFFSCRTQVTFAILRALFGKDNNKKTLSIETHK